MKLLQEHKLDLQSQMSQEEKKLDEWKVRIDPSQAVLGCPITLLLTHGGTAP